MREARRIEDARFPCRNPPNQNPASSSPRIQGTFINQTITEGANRDAEIMVQAPWPQRLESCQSSQTAGMTNSDPLSQLQTSLESENPISSHSSSRTGLVVGDFATSLPSFIDWAQINDFAMPTGGNCQFGFYAEGLYGEDEISGVDQHLEGALGVRIGNQAWMST